MDRITVTEKQLASAIAVWLRLVPSKVWAQLIEHKILEFYKRHNSAERLDGQIAEHIASEMTKHDWQVTHPAGRSPIDLSRTPRG